MTTPQPQNEAELINQISDNFLDAKVSLQKAQRALTEVMQINTDKGRLDAANAAMRVRGEVRCIRGNLDVMHSNATVDMSTYYPEFSAEVQVRGGGGGR